MPRKYLLGVLVFITAILTCPHICAQPMFDNATKDVDRNVREKISGKIVTAPRETAEPKEAPSKATLEGNKLFVKSIRLDGVKSFPAEDFKTLIGKYENRDVFEDELKDILTKEIEREYLKKGVIAACFVPPQEIEDGAVVLRVVEAKMGRVKVDKQRYFSSDRLLFYWAVKAGEVLQYDKISRSLQFMNKNPDRQVKVTLSKGEKPETTDALLTAKTTFPAHFTAIADNEGSVATGKIRKGIGLVENNFIGLDDTLMVGYTGGKNFGGIYAYHRVPVTSYGTSILYGYNITRSFPKKDFEQFGLSSQADSASIFAYQDIFVKDVYKGELSFGLEAKDKHVVATQGTINYDRLRFVRAGVMLQQRDEMGLTSFKPEYSQGLNMFGAKRKSEFSSRNAENTPSKLNLNVNFTRRLVKNIQAQIKLNGQAASEKLMPQEELYMGGIDSVRGYPSGDYLADTGFYSNFELQVPPSFIPDWVKFPYGERPIKDEINGVIFFDYGYGMKRGMIEGEQADRRMASIGAGVRVRLCSQALLRLEWAVPLDPMVNRPITEDGGNRPRLHFSIDFQDQIPSEVERLSKEYKKNQLVKQSWITANREIRDPSSDLSRKICGYFYMARRAETEGDLARAGRYYAKVLTIGRSAQRQAEADLEKK